MPGRLRAFFNPATPDPLRAPRRIFWVGFAVRVLYLTLAHTYRIRGAEDHFQFGWEAGRIARALVTGYGYADPFANAFYAHTGPTAWLPPLYPLLLAGIFKLFGVFTLTSAWVLFTLQSAFSAATALATWEIAARILNRRVALWSAWIWALYPAAMQYAVRWPWEMTITTALFSFVLVLSLRMRGIGQGTGIREQGTKCREQGLGNREQGTKCREQGLGNREQGAKCGEQETGGYEQGARVGAAPWQRSEQRDHGTQVAPGRSSLFPVPCSLPCCSLPSCSLPSWLVFGVLWALIALSNSTLLIFLPVNGLWILLPRMGDLRGMRGRGIAGVLAGPALAALVFLACIAPWTIRNFDVFHTFIPLRGNFGAELYMGNGPGANGLLMEYYHPFQDPTQLRLYAEMGEVRYVAMRAAAAKAIIAAHPGHFLADCGRRVYFFWAGVPHPSDEAWYNEVGRTVNFAFLSLAGLFGLALALRNRVPAAGLLGWAFLLLPVPYYVVTVHARFRHPLEPLIAILGVYLFQSAERRGRVPKS